jgi:hypothetical protein
MKTQLLLLELNEVNFGFVQKYCARGALPNFQKLLQAHPLISTTSERNDAELEPWIQWVTAHTGLGLAEHGVFRLGDIVRHDLPQIWEVLEAQGISVGAVSPMNAKNRLKAPAFFVPDPWTSTKASGGAVLKRLYAAIAQTVNDNAQAKLTPGSALNLGLGLAWYARPQNYARYLFHVLRARQRPWRKAIFLDQLLSDVFVAEVSRTRPHFASLFLNAAAHIQHHYMFNSSSYDGVQRNPAWYAPDGSDPLYEVYESYDRLIGDLRHAFPGARLMLATGLHQVPHERLTYYWRLKKHADFLLEVGVHPTRCEPRMSRDFLITFATRDEAEAGAARLSAAVAADGTPMFQVDNRGTDVFVSLVYSRDIGPDFTFSINGTRYTGLANKVAFVALKNGEHDGIGYFLDSALQHGTGPMQIPLGDLPTRIAEVFGLQFQPARQTTQVAGAPSA